MRYVRSIPKRVPPGLILVHNHVVPVGVGPRATLAPGVNGFRAWFERRRRGHRVCRCGWAPDIAKHFRMSLSW